MKRLGRPPSAAKRKAFLEAYSRCGNISQAAKIAKVHRESHRVWMSEPDYKSAFEEASEQACDLLVQEARRRAHEGIRKPVIYQGEMQFKLDKEGKRTNVPLTVREYSDVLLIFLIKGARPDVYRDNYKAEVIHKGTMLAPPAGAPDLSRLNEEQYEQFKRLVTIASNGHGEAVPEPDSSRG